MKKLATLTLCLIMAISFISTTAEARRSRPRLVTVHIPIETIDALKHDNVKRGILGLRMVAHSPRSLYLLRSMERVNQAKKIKDSRIIFNIGTSYHNLYLFLKSEGFTSNYFFKGAEKYYKKASRTKNISRKNYARLAIASLYAEHGNHKKAKKLYHKTDIDQLDDKLRRNSQIALYWAAMNEPDKAILNLKLAYELNANQTKFWLGISDDFYSLNDNPEFKKLMKKWKVVRLNKGRMRRIN